MTNYAKVHGPTRKGYKMTDQNRAISGRESEMTENHAGGYSFELDEFKRLKRFLIIGVETNTYYQGQRDLVIENVESIRKCLQANPKAVVDTIVEVSTHGLALRQDPGLYALAMAASYRIETPDNTQGAEVRAYALSKLHLVARTGTTLYQFAEYVKSMRGWGRSLRRAFAAWYVEKPLNKLALQAWKYKQRQGWTHRDAMRLAHPITDDTVRNEVFKYLTHPDESPLAGHVLDEMDITIYTKAGTVRKQSGLEPLAQIQAAEELLHLTGDGKREVSKAVKLILAHRLTHEAVPTQLKKSPDVWEALLEHMPIQALVTNLGRMTSIGLLAPFSAATNRVTYNLGNEEAIERSRIHPMRFLIALKQYQHGRGMSGQTWNAVPAIGDVLDSGFYKAFGNVVPTGKRILIAVDDSGSMTSTWAGNVMGMDNFLPSEAAAAMALVTYATEPNSHLITFNTVANEIQGLSRKARIDHVTHYIGRGGATNTAAPIDYLLRKKFDVEAVVSYTDCETWAGRSGWGYGHGSRNPGHVTEKLDKLNRKVGHSVKFLNCAVTATNCTDVDPKNCDMFELTGFSADTPKLISEYINGDI